MRAVGDHEAFERLREVVPYFIESGEGGKMNVIACMSRSAIAEATARGIQIEILQLDLESEARFLFISIRSVSVLPKSLAGRRSF